MGWDQVCRRAERLGCHIEGASLGLGSNRCLLRCPRHRLLCPRRVPRPRRLRERRSFGRPKRQRPHEDTAARKNKLNAELANGRLAMMAIIGMFFQDGLTGSAWGDWELYTGSPLR